jgi:hypothetical protein
MLARDNPDLRGSFWPRLPWTKAHSSVPATTDLK